MHPFLPGLMSVSQTYSVSYATSYGITRTAAKGNLMNRTRSGNPGYITGRPVVAGYEVTSGTYSAIKAQLPGLKVMGISPTGLCDDVGSMDVLFGADIR